MIFQPPRKGTSWRASGFDPELGQAIAGTKQFGAELVGSIDAMSVLAKRVRHEGFPSAADFYVPKFDVTPAIAGLRDYQLGGIRRLVGNLQVDGGCILADDMGLGKTVQTIGVWNALKRPVPLLVVAPATVRRGWMREFQQWANLKPTLVETGKQAAAVTNNDKVVVTSYELAKKLGTSFCPHMLVMDEAHLLRGRAAGRSTFLLELARTSSYRLALTGTPMWSRPRDFWMLLKILFGYRFGTADEFDYSYCAAFVNQWGGKDNKGAARLDELKQRLEYVMLRRTKEQLITELPELTRQIRWVPAVKSATKALEASVLNQISFTDALTATLDAKVDAAIEAAQNSDKFLLFTWQKRHAELMHERLNDEGYPCEILTGDYSHAEREAAVDRARKNGSSVVATIDSTNAGVNGLQYVASTAVFHSIDYVPIKMAQAEARLHRIGQKNAVTVVYIAMEDSADSFVVSTVVEKLDQWKAAMGADTTSSMNDTLDSPQSAQHEAAALNAIFAAMESEQ
jgi:SWI/SNF-related matrix-associated actin-dependent regulator of chromatin subfamily A-like protein 1